MVPNIWVTSESGFVDCFVPLHGIVFHLLLSVPRVLAESQTSCIRETKDNVFTLEYRAGGNIKFLWDCCDFRVRAGLTDVLINVSFFLGGLCVVYFRGGISLVIF